MSLVFDVFRVDRLMFSQHLFNFSIILGVLVLFWCLLEAPRLLEVIKEPCLLDWLAPPTNMAQAMSFGRAKSKSCCM